ncbi:MAG: DUF1566 domain-containing protein [Sulfurimonas sp.]|nr:DUF1566 domain-containing protein [Sulfurimonas sp.]
MKLFFILFASLLSVVSIYSSESKYSTYPSKKSLTLILNTPILLNPNADKYHKTFFTNMIKAQLFLQRNKNIAFTKDERSALSAYNTKFKSISIAKSLLTGSDKDTAAQNFKFDAQKLSDALALTQTNTLDISLTIRDVLEKSIVIEGYRTINEEGKFSFSEFYTITLDDFDISSYSNCVNLMRFIILNPMKPYTNKEITPEAKETVVQEYSKDTIKQISYNNKKQFIKVYAKNITVDQYFLSSYFKLTPNSLIGYNSKNEVEIPALQAKEYCKIFDMKAQLSSSADKLTFKCIGAQQKRINYIPRYALKDTPSLVKFKELLANKKETIVYNKKKNINEIWDIELGVKVFSFKYVFELMSYDLPKDARYMLLDTHYHKMDKLSSHTKQILIYETAKKHRVLNPKTQNFYTDLKYEATLHRSMKISDNSIDFKIDRSVYKLYKENGFEYQNFIAKYVIDTYIDPKSKLMWQNNDGLKKLTYDSARSYCSSLKVGFVSGWRVPTEKEILTIKEKKSYRHKQSLSNSSFIKKELSNSSKISWQNFWTSTKNDLNTNSMIGVSFNFPSSGTWYSLNKELYIRCVRDFR